jgi:hypothetical protein
MPPRVPPRFALPRVTRRGTSFALVALVLTLGIAYTIYYPACCAKQRVEAAALQDFRNTCVQAARHANGGGDLVMDDATEEKIGAYCGCMADAVGGNLAPPEIARIAQGAASDKTMQLLTRIVEGCKAKLE